MSDPKPEFDLLDINVWLALTDENHAHHSRARIYWECEAARQLVFTRVTMLGFVRLLTNRAVMNDHPYTPQEAWAAYRAFRDLPDVLWVSELNDDAEATDALLSHWIELKDFSTLHWTDGYLAALASTLGCRLVSFDSGYQRFQPLTYLHLKP